MNKPEGIASERLNEFGLYFNELLSHDQRKDFEIKLKNDPDFFRDFMVYKSFYTNKSIRIFRGDFRELSFTTRRKLKVAGELSDSGFLVLAGAVFMLAVAVLVAISLR